MKEQLEEILKTVEAKDVNEFNKRLSSASDAGNFPAIMKVQDINGLTLLHHIAAVGDHRIMSAVIDHMKRDENQVADEVLYIVDSLNRPALFYAVQNGHHQCLSLLLDYDISQIDNDQLKDEIEVASWVDQHSKKTNVLSVAMSRLDWNSISIILLSLLRKRHNLDDDVLKYLVNQKNNQLCALIHLAYTHEKYRIISLLIKFGELLDVNAKDNEGYTTYHRAVMEDNKKVIEILKKHADLDVNAPVKNSRIQKLLSGAREVLLEGDDLDSDDDFNYQLALDAAVNAMVGCVGSDDSISPDEHEGDPPLVALVKDFYEESHITSERLMELVQDHKIDLECGDGKGDKALKIAKQYLSFEKIKQLEALRADINHAIRDINGTGRKELHAVLSQCADEDLRTLLEWCEQAIDEKPLIHGLVNFNLNKRAQQSKRKSQPIDLTCFQDEINNILICRFKAVKLSKYVPVAKDEGKQESNGNSSVHKSIKYIDEIRDIFSTCSYEVLQELIDKAKNSKEKYVLLMKNKAVPPQTDDSIQSDSKYGAGFPNDSHALAPENKIFAYCPLQKAITVAKEILDRSVRKPYYFSSVLADDEVKGYIILKAAYPERGLESSSGDSEEDDNNLLREDIEQRLKEIILHKNKNAIQSDQVATKPAHNFVPIFRGINFLRDKFIGKIERIKYLQKISDEKVFYAASCYNLLGKKPTDVVPPEQLDKEAENIARKLASLNNREVSPIKKPWECSVPWMFNSLRYLLQNYYTVNKNAFDKNVLQALPSHIRTMAEARAQGITAIFDDNPFVSGSALPRHSVRYALGDSRASSKIDRVLNPRYNSKTGRPKRPIAGVIFISLYPEEDYINADLINVVKSHAEGEMNISKELLNESEITFPVRMDHICMSLPILYPSFEGLFKPITKNEQGIHIDLYGFTKKEFEKFKKLIMASNRGTQERQDTEENLRKKLTLFYTHILWQMAKKHVEALGGKLAVELPNGEFCTDDVENLRPKKLAEQADKIHKEKLSKKLNAEVSENFGSVEEVGAAAEEQQEHNNYAEGEDAVPISYKENAEDGEEEDEEELQISRQDKDDSVEQLVCPEDEEQEDQKQEDQKQDEDQEQDGEVAEQQQKEVAQDSLPSVLLNKAIPQRDQGIPAFPAGTIKNSANMLLFGSAQKRRPTAAIDEDKKVKRQLSVRK